MDIAHSELHPHHSIRSGVIGVANFRSSMPIPNSIHNSMLVESAWNMSSVDVKPSPPMERATFDTGMRVEPLPVLPATEDVYGGVTVEMKKNGTLSPESFAILLRNSMSMWKKQGKRGVWIRFHRGVENLLEIAAKEGFENHHAHREYIMMTHWIPKTPCTLPGNATHRVTIGALVLNHRREVLVVQEKKGKFRGLWKIPTGTVDEVKLHRNGFGTQGEDIHVAAVREVKEETGIDTEFLEILSVKELHNALFGWSELTFFCMMRPTSFDIQTEEAEIDAAEWMPMEEFAAQRFAREDELCRHVVELCFVKLDSVYTGLTPREVTSALDYKSSVLYLNGRDLDNSTASADRP